MIVQENTVIGEGGEILSSEIKTIKKVSLDQFCQVYLQDNEEFYCLSKAESNILSLCWRYSVYYDDKELDLPGNKVIVDKQMRNIMMQKTGLAESTIKNAFTTLVKKDMLIKDHNYKSVYYLNPKYFFKGTLSSRTKSIKHSIEYVLRKD